ncbi:MAG: hypothetical protein JJU33_01860 [Phycisphaerales bacterium]|nr:hypothetical protein [Phycisphaerales bacterium]
MDEKKPQHGDGLPDGVPPEAVKPDDSSPFTDALLAGAGWPRLRVWHWLLPLVVVLVLSVLFLRPVVSGESSLAESRLIEVLVFFGVFFAVYGVGIVLGRRRFRVDGDLPRARKLVRRTLIVGVGGLAAVLGGAHFFGGFALRSMYMSMTPVVVSWLLLWWVFLRLGLLGERGVDDSLRCAACDYPYEGAGSDRCPECGAAWHEPAALLARHTTKERWNASAVVFYVLLFVVMTLALSQREKFYAVTPTGRLVASVGVHGDSYDWHLWRQIIGRTLTQAQTAHLAERILNEPASDRINTFASEWFVARLNAGEISQDHLERFVRERVVLSLDASPDGTGGDVRVVATADAFGWSLHSLRFELAGIGFGVDGGPPVARATNYQSISHGENVPEEAQTTQWTHLITGLEPGERSLRFECWVVLTHGTRGSATLVWQSPAIPAPVHGSVGEVRLEASTSVNVMR